MRIARFLPTLKLEHKPGSANVVADALSRAPAADVRDSNAVLVVSEGLSVDRPNNLQFVQEQQREDSELVKLIKFLEIKELPSDPTEAKVVLSQAKKGYYMVEGVLYFDGADMPDRRRLVVPKHLWEQILEEHHDAPYAGHFAAKRMNKRLNQYYYWAGMRADVHRKCSSCVECASVQGQGNPGRPPLKSIEVGGPFECIGMDFLEMDTSKRGSKYALVFQDYLSKWPEVYPVKDRKAETVARCLLDLMWRHGVPTRIIHDRAAEFLSDVIQETAKLIGLEQLPTSGGHPQTDGLVEHFNRTLKQMLAKLVSKGGRDWDELLGPVLFAYRTTPHSSTGESPFVLVYGRNARMPTSLDFSAPTVRYPIVATEYAKELCKDLKATRELAGKSIRKAQIGQKTQYDKGVRERDLQKGDLVMLKVQPRFKLDRPYRGPFEVQSLSSTNAVIKLVNDKNAEPWNVSRQRLSKCHPGMERVQKPWVGHSKRLRRRRVLKYINKGIGSDNSQPAKRSQSAASSENQQIPQTRTKTRSGRVVRTPLRFKNTDSPGARHVKEGEVVRPSQESTREGIAREPERDHAVVLKC